jgi:hypothetical protein
MSEVVEFPAEEAMHLKSSYSIEGEDILIRKLLFDYIGLPSDHIGFYVDLGAFDPICASNTYGLYKRGWSGLNVEANKRFIDRFQIMRPRDTTLNVAIGPDGQSGIYTEFDNHIINGFLDDVTIRHHLSIGRKIVSQTAVDFVSVETICDRFLSNMVVDLLNIDIETMEERILRSWDFRYLRPKLICVEIHGDIAVQDIMNQPVSRLLAERGYIMASRLWHSSIFIDADLAPVKAV